MNIPLGIIFGLISMASYGIVNALSKIPANEYGNTKTIFVRNIFVSIFVFIIFLFSSKNSDVSVAFVLLAFMIGMIGYLPVAFFFKSINTGKVGVVVPVANTSIIFTVLLAVVFFNEVLRTAQVLAMLLIIAGVVVISVNFKALKNSNFFSLKSGIPFAIMASILWGVVYFLFKIPVAKLGPFLASFLIETGVAVAAGIHLGLFKIKLTKPSRRVTGYVLFTAVLIGMGTLFYNLGISNSDVSIVAAITFSSPLVSAITAKIVFKERSGFKEYAAIFMIITGIVLTSLV